MPQFFIALFIAQAFSKALSNSNDECCYIYGSVPYNNSICIPEGGQVSLVYIIYNSHDIFTNLSVIWFRSTTVTDTMSNYESITMAYQNYHIFALTPVSPTVSDSVGNCSLDLYRDAFILIINNFTMNDNGYYWCQVVINDTYTQPSRHVWFYADSTSCNRSVSFQTFRPAISNELQCAVYYDTDIAPSTSSQDERLTASTIFTFLSSTSSIISAVIQPTTTSSAVIQPHSSESTLILIIGILSTLLCITFFGLLIILLFTLHLYKRLRKKNGKLEHQQRVISDSSYPQQENTKYKEEFQSGVYQTLNLDEMNYESMYAKPMPT